MLWSTTLITQMIILNLKQETDHGYSTNNETKNKSCLRNWKITDPF